MLVASCGSRPKIALERITTVEEFAHVLPDVMLQHELATRMVPDKSLEIHDELIQQN